MKADAASPMIRAVLIQDASPERNQLVRVLQRDGDIAVVGQSSNGAEVVGLVAQARPDVLVLDLNLDDGSSQHAIEQVMARTPTPILVLSSRIHDRDSPSAVEALVAGALDALPTPAGWTPELEVELRNSLRQLRKVRVIRHPRGGLAKSSRRQPQPAGEHPVVAVAASTGGPTALATLLSGLGGLVAPVLVVQHLHPEFTSGLLVWMSRVSALPVEMATHGQIPEPGHVYLAPGGVHLRLGNDRLELDPSPATTHRPSADQLFGSVAERAGARGIGVLLTGMGEDGARGLLELQRQGGRTLGQDEATSAVFGMPRAAQRLGAVAELLPLELLAAAIRRAVAEVRR